MSLSVNADFSRLVDYLKAQGAAAQKRTEDSQEYRDFLQAFPLSRLNQLTLDEYCVGKGDGASFCWWIERGLVPVLGRYMPGTAKGHLLYFQEDGSLYKNRRLLDLGDEEALRYTLSIQSTIASTDPADLLWVDDDKEIYRRAGVEPRVTVGAGRKLRLLSCYYPASTLPISSSDHLGHYLQQLGCPEQDIPRRNQPVARMLKLREYYLLACESVPGLSPYGFMRGLYNEELGLRPSKPESEQDVQPGQPSYLLTWNPAHFKLGGDAGVELGQEIDWSCHSKQPQPGDVVYLVRLGQEPRGIVARGLVTEGAHDGPDWKDASKTRNYIRFRIDEHRPDCARGLLPMLLLNKAMPTQRWNPQSSGVEITPAIAARLELLWQAGEGQHSLKQYVAWSTADSKESCPHWLAIYQDITALAKALRSGEKPLDQVALTRLWLERENGVSSLPLGLFSKDEMQAQQAAVREITQGIMAAPTAQTYAQVMRDWSVGVEKKQFSTNRPAMINRVFAAFAPERFTTLLKSDDCQRLLRGLNEQFQLAVAVDSSGWCGLNEQIMACMRLADIDGAAVLPNNIAMWQLLEALKGAKAETREAQEEEDVTVAAKNTPLNQILFGPPGTGKTFSVVDETLKILEPEALVNTSREAKKKAFDQLALDGRVRFVTFHQSFSYEDFVEGLRAVSEGGQLNYKVEPGVFKLLCDDARHQDGEQTEDDVLNVFIEEVSEAPVTLTTVRGKAFEVRYRAGNGTFTCSPQASESGLELPANIEHVRAFLRGEKPASVYCESYVRGIADYLRSRLDKGAEEKSADEKKPYVLVIDEINRGNVSRIFGELITLIEASKREGAAEALSVSLPYSKERFSVPDNVYLIGTMNTADRSLAGLDIALRRRFVFEEMMPNPSLLNGVVVEGIDIGQLLAVMNQRIEVLLDRDHCLGHAYFMSLKSGDSLQQLEVIFRNQILPLLQEYFFEDWQRIQWVLNDHRKAAADRFVEQDKQDVDALFGNISVPAQGGVWRINAAAFQRVSAYAGVIAVHGKAEGPVKEPEEANA
ncbi:AAA family ATPase [Balneatrix alpica]|uniref:AAA family ATPase n=1 Tax=Balneatrix alpica TaxID=75684 RepID=A0ABV5ZFV1_9GAMM|nr:AAA family ATPase [Balneatrix alpica]